MNHRFTLQPYNGPDSRYYCPKCQHRRRTFTRYIDAETGHELANMLAAATASTIAAIITPRASILPKTPTTCMLSL